MAVSPILMSDLSILQRDRFVRKNVTIGKIYCMRHLDRVARE